MTVPGGSPLHYPIGSQPAIKRVSLSRAPTSNDYRNFREGDEWLHNTSSDWYKLANIAAQTATWVLIGGTSGAAEEFIPDSGTSPVVPDATNQITMTGTNGLTVVGGLNTLTFQPSDGGFPITPFVVGPVGKAGYQTIQAGINAAVASKGTVFIQPGTYTENLNFLDGVQVVGATGISQEENDGVKIVGIHAPPISGHFVVRNIHFSSASSIFSSVAVGSTHIHIIDSESAVTNGWLFDLVNWTGTLEIENYNSASGATNDGGINNTGGSTILLFNAGLGFGSANSLVTSGPVIMEQGEVNCPSIFGAGSILDIEWMQFNATITTSGDCTGIFFATSFTTTSECLNHGSTGTIEMTQVRIDTTNNPSIDGSGTGVLTIDGNFTKNTIIAGTLTISGSYTKTGTIEVVNGYTLPTVDGTASQVMTTDGAGTASWSSSGNLATMAIQTFTSNGTYTPTAGMEYCIIEVVGGGGGGGGAPTAGSIGSGGGGGSGGYSRVLASAATIGVSQVVTIGAAGTAGASGGAGGNGGNTTVGALLTGGGGNGGLPGGAGGGTAGVGSGGDLNVAGTPGGDAPYVGGASNIAALSGFGGSSYYGGGAEAQSINLGVSGSNLSENGHPATGHGGGGGGGAKAGTGTATGGIGFVGFVIITEYI